MNASITIKKHVASLCFGAGLFACKLKQVSNDGLVILMYHRVIHRDGAERGVQAGMYVSPHTFEEHILLLKRYFSLCPISQVLAWKTDSTAEDRPAKPLCVLTFDDGWSDFYHYAFPILQSYGVPATVFLPTDYIGTGKSFWTDRLASLLHQAFQTGGATQGGNRVRNSMANRVANLKGSFESRLETAIELMKSLPARDVERIIEDLSWILGTDAVLNGRAFLSWSEVREMSRSGIVTFGSHTASHRILTTLGRNEIEKELRKSREMLLFENVVDPSCIPFCYPNGSYNEEIAGMVRDAGYSLAVTTKRGWNHPASDMFTLRRVGIHQDMASTQAMFACRIVGLL